MDDDNKKMLYEEPNINWFQKHVVDSLGRLEEGQKDMTQKFDAHTSDDRIQFEKIRSDVLVAKTLSEERAGRISRLWAFGGALIATIISLISHYLFKK